MKNIESIADKELLVKMSDLSGREQKTTAEVVLYLNQIDQRKLYREAGYSSLFTYCREKLGYSEGAACRRPTAKTRKSINFLTSPAPPRNTGLSETCPTTLGAFLKGL